jgi:hypothetical protein
MYDSRSNGWSSSTGTARPRKALEPYEDSACSSWSVAASSNISSRSIAGTYVYEGGGAALCLRTPTKPSAVAYFRPPFHSMSVLSGIVSGSLVAGGVCKLPFSRLKPHPHVDFRYTTLSFLKTCCLAPWRTRESELSHSILNTNHTH